MAKKTEKITCTRCHGKGMLYTITGSILCPTCAGIGKIVINKPIGLKAGKKT